MSSFDSPHPIEPGAGSDLTMPGGAFAESEARVRERPREAAAEDGLTCPACSFEQPPADECLKCGLVISKYRSRREPPPPPPGFEVRSADEVAADLAAEGYHPRERVASEDVDDGFFAPEKKGLAKGMLGGIVMMAIAAVWFGLGWAAGYIFFYPPILFVIGLFGFLKGLFSGNVAGA